MLSAFSGLNGNLYEILNHYMKNISPKEFEIKKLKLKNSYIENLCFQLIQSMDCQFKNQNQTDKKCSSYSKVYHMKKKHVCCFE